MGERLYSLRHGQEVFDTGMAQGKQVLLANTVQDILLHWFAPDGQFLGLTGRTIIRLEDGTVWKQANADDRYRPKNSDRPAAAVIHGVFGYKMQIEGMQPFYVDPVRNP